MCHGKLRYISFNYYYNNTFFNYYLEYKHNNHKTAFRARNVNGGFEKQKPAPLTDRPFSRSEGIRLQEPPLYSVSHISQSWKLKRQQQQQQNNHFLKF